MALLHKPVDGRSASFSFLGSSPGLRDGYAKGGAAVQDGDADLKFGHLAVEVPRHEPLAQPFHAVHPIAGKTIHRIVFLSG